MTNLQGLQIYIKYGLNSYEICFLAGILLGKNLMQISNLIEMVLSYTRKNKYFIKLNCNAFPVEKDLCSTDPKQMFQSLTRKTEYKS